MELPPIASPYLVPFDGTFRLAQRPSQPDKDAPGKKANQEALADAVTQLAKLQKRLYADNRYAVLLVFQAMDAAGKDGTISAVLSGVNPQGCEVTAFKAPSAEELDHDFLWRVQRALPQRGRIGVWNRSHYEEVLVVRVNPGLLDKQNLPTRVYDEPFWQRRYESINAAEQHWARSGCVVLKFFLHVSRDEQHRRFRERMDDPESNWKFDPRDVQESQKWEAYQAAYQQALAHTSRPWAPWYVIPADSKSYMRRTVADIVQARMASLGLAYPTLPPEARAQMEALRATLLRG